MSITVQWAGQASTWLRCTSCDELIYRPRWLRNLEVCPLCRHHSRMSARGRIEALADAGSFHQLTADEGDPDPLGFVDELPYPQRLERARTATGEREAVVCGHARVRGRSVVLAVMDFRFMGGSLGSGTGELITVAAESALADRTPLLLVCASGGARMQEGILSLLQMAKISQAIARLNEAGILVVSLITDPTYGGVAASFATQADVVLAEPGARLGFAGPRVIRDTIGQQLPPGFQTAEHLLAHGLLDAVVERSRLPEQIGLLLEVADAEGAELPAPDHADTGHVVAAGSGDPWDIVRAARGVDRPTTRDYLNRICDWFVELRGDRMGSDSRTIVGGIGRLGDRHVVMVGTQKGHTSRELSDSNFGMAGPDGYRKAMRLFALAERLRLPVVTLVDTPGAYPGIEAENQGQAHTIAASILRLSSVRTPVVTIIIGEGGSGGALALAVADSVHMMANAIYSVISPEGCAAILWSAGEAARAAAALRLTAPDLTRMGVIDGVIAEPAGGARADHDAAATGVRRTIERVLGELAGLNIEDLVERRRRRLRRIGGAAPASTGSEITA